MAQHPIRNPHSAIRNPQSGVRAFLALIGGATGIGFAPVLVRLSETGPSATAFYRLLFALPLLWLWASMDQRKPSSFRRPGSRRDFALLIVAGLFFTGDLSIWHWSLQFTTVANATLLTNLAPIFVTVGARIVFGDRVTPGFVLGMTLALGGAVLLVGTSYTLSARHLLGDAL